MHVLLKYSRHLLLYIFCNIVSLFCVFCKKRCSFPLFQCYSKFVAGRHLLESLDSEKDNSGICLQLDC